MKNATYLILGIIIIALIVGSLSTLLSARHLAEENSNAGEIYDAFIASKAGIEATKCYIEENGISEAGRMPYTFHLNGALFEVHWSELDPKDSSIKIISRGAVLIDEMIVEKSIIDTMITISYEHPSTLNPLFYFGE